MDRYNYDKKLSTGIVATVGTLGILIPPSVTLIVFGHYHGAVHWETLSRRACSGIDDRLFLYLHHLRMVPNKSRSRPERGRSPPGGRRFASLPEVLWVVGVFLLVIGGLMYGFFTPTEAGSVGTFAVLLLSVIKRDIGFKGYIKSVIESLRTACMVLMLIAGSTVLGHFLARTKIPMIAADWIVTLPLSPDAIMIIISVIYLLGGSFIDDPRLHGLATPIFLSGHH